MEKMELLRREISTSSTKPMLEDEEAEEAIKQSHPISSNSQHKRSGVSGYLPPKVPICSCCSSELRLWTVLYAVLTACIMTFLVGTTLTYSSLALLQLTQLQDPQLRFDTLLAGIFGASSLVGAIFGGPIAGYVADRWGRKFSLVLNSVSYLVGYFIILSAYLATNGVVFKTALMVGRFITGIGMGWTYIVVPIYIAEVAPTEQRSMLGTFSELSLTIGALVLYGLGSIPGFRYYNLANVQIGILVLFMFLVVFIPETPRWLFLKFKNKQLIISTLGYLRGPENKARIIEEYTSIQSSLPEKDLNVCQKLRLIFFQRSLLIPFLLVTFLYVFQELCGAGSTVEAYAGEIFKEAGVSNPDLTATYSVGGSLVVGTIVASLLIERLGRKVLLSVSAAGMATGSTMLGVHNYFTRPEACSSSNTTRFTVLMEDSDKDACNPQLFPLAIVAVIVFVLSFSFGLGPVPWVMLSEYLPLQVRGVAGGIVVASNWTAGVLITGGFLSYSELVGSWFAWWTIGAINLVGLVIVVVFIKETKGRTLEEIEELFDSKNSYCCTRPLRLTNNVLNNSTRL